MFVTKQKADKGECKNSVYKLPLCAASTKREVEKNRVKGEIIRKCTFWAVENSLSKHCAQKVKNVVSVLVLFTQFKSA